MIWLLPVFSFCASLVVFCLVISFPCVCSLPTSPLSSWSCTLPIQSLFPRKSVSSTYFEIFSICVLWNRFRDVAINFYLPLSLEANWLIWGGGEMRVYTFDQFHRAYLASDWNANTGNSKKNSHIQFFVFFQKKKISIQNSCTFYYSCALYLGSTCMSR